MRVQCNLRLTRSLSEQTRLDHRLEDAHQRRQAQLGQGLQADQRAEEGQGHGLLLRQSSTGQDPQAKVRRVRIRLSQGKLLVGKNNNHGKLVQEEEKKEAEHYL